MSDSPRSPGEWTAPLESVLVADGHDDGAAEVVSARPPGSASQIAFYASPQAPRSKVSGLGDATMGLHDGSVPAGMDDRPGRAHPAETGLGYAFAQNPAPPSVAVPPTSFSAVISGLSGTQSRAVLLPEDGTFRLPVPSAAGGLASEESKAEDGVPPVYVLKASSNREIPEYCGALLLAFLSFFFGITMVWLMGPFAYVLMLSMWITTTVVYWNASDERSRAVAKITLFFAGTSLFLPWLILSLIIVTIFLAAAISVSFVVARIWV